MSQSRGGSVDGSHGANNDRESGTSTVCLSAENRGGVGEEGEGEGRSDDDGVQEGPGGGDGMYSSIVPEASSGLGSWERRWGERDGWGEGGVMEYMSHAVESTGGGGGKREGGGGKVLRQSSASTAVENGLAFYKDLALRAVEDVERFSAQLQVCRVWEY